MLGVCQRCCPPISCGASDFRDADFGFRIKPDRTGAGADFGAKTMTRAITGIETAKLNGLDPQGYLADIINRLDELLPWSLTPLAAETGSQAI